MSSKAAPSQSARESNPLPLDAPGTNESASAQTIAHAAFVLTFHRALKRMKALTRRNLRRCASHATSRIVNYKRRGKAGGVCDTNALVAGMAMIGAPAAVMRRLVRLVRLIRPIRPTPPIRPIPPIRLTCVVHRARPARRFNPHPRLVTLNNRRARAPVPVPAARGRPPQPRLLMSRVKVPAAVHRQRAG